MFDRIQRNSIYILSLQSGWIGKWINKMSKMINDVRSDIKLKFYESPPQPEFIF